MAGEDEKVMADLQELQEKAIMQAQAQRKNDVAREIAEKRKKLAILTKQELDGMPADVITYKSVGRAYFLTPKAEINAQLDSRAAECEADIAKSKEQAEALNQKLKDTDQQLKELFMQHEGIARRFGAVRVS